MHYCRDLKCENVLLDGNNNIKVSDFGFSRFLKPGDMSRTFCGSAAYAAPEILQGIPYTGYSYDIWSIGVILYIMVSERPIMTRGLVSGWMIYLNGLCHVCGWMLYIN